MGIARRTSPRGCTDRSSAWLSISSAWRYSALAWSTMRWPNSVTDSWREVRLNRRPPRRSSRRATARETVGTDTPMALDAAA